MLVAANSAAMRRKLTAERERGRAKSAAGDMTGLCMHLGLKAWVRKHVHVLVV